MDEILVTFRSQLHKQRGEALEMSKPIQVKFRSLRRTHHVDGSDTLSEICGLTLSAFVLCAQTAYTAHEDEPDLQVKH